MSQRFSGAILSYLQISIKLVTTLFFTPVLITALGQEGYGLFSIVGALAAYLYILDFGINDSVLRFFVAHERNHKKRDSFLGQMLSLYAMLGVGVALVAWGLYLLTDQIFGANFTVVQVETLQSMILITATGAVILISFNPITALLSAAEQFVFLRTMEILATVLSAIITVVFLKLGYGAITVVTIMSASMIIQVILRIIYCNTQLGVRLRYSRPLFNDVRPVMIYAIPIFVSMIGEVLFWKFDNILIGALIGAAPVAVYAIGVMFNKYFMSFATAISRIMTPEIVRRVDAGADTQELTNLMVRISRVQALILLMVLGGVIVFGARFLTLWLGQEYTVSYYVLLAVLIPYTLELTGNARNVILQVKQLYWYKSLITLFMAVVNIPLTIFLLSVWGVVGAAISTGVSVFIGYLMVAVLLQRRVGISMKLYWLETARGILPAALVVIVMGLVLEQYLPEGWLWFALGGAAFCFTYLLFVAFFAINESEKSLIGKFFARFNLQR